MAIQNVTESYVLAQTAGDTYNGDSRDQTYSISPFLTGAGETITIVDQGGNNAIELPAGLTITSSLVVSDQAILTLSNGAVIDIRGANTFTYKVGQNVLVGDTTGADLNYADFAQDVLGVTLDGGNLVEGGQVTVDDTGGGGLPVLPTVSLAPTNGQTTEGDNGNTVVTFTATLSSASDDLVAVDYATASSTAQSDVDFLAASGSLVFSPGTTQRTFDVEIVGDTEYEPDEIFRVELSNPQGAVLDQSGTVIKGFEALHTILDDDQPSTPSDDHSNNRNSTATALTFGDVTTGEIERNGDEDVFRIELEAGRQYTVELNNMNDLGITDETVRMAFYDQNNRIFDSIIASAGENTGFTFEADGTGTFFYEVSNLSSGGPDGNTYAVQIDELSGSDDHSNNRNSTATALTFGDVTTGEIERNGDEDVFRIELEAGRQYTVELNNMNDLGITDETVRMAFYDQNNRIFDSIIASAGENTGFTFEADGTGTFFYEVSNLSSGGPDGNTYAVQIDVFI
ncbi:Calx-beta domain-containing protein [Marivita sp. GX14005]|uniref:Calx-beta domain-containing protein n=1 Tax=Marivita sp. GX14005 TaxID=2942276 RepID=UPI002018F61E|nr:Calx-beta domain-containing protein [Marivita sp. GX14005]MCL3880764.1 hypothetical protein [Marivita sp. GX14005]